MHQYKRLMKGLDELRWNNLQTKLDKKAKSKTVCDICYHLVKDREGRICVYILLICTYNFLIAPSCFNHMNVLLIQVISCI